ncbi:MerR family transcriptional regulator [Pseudoalteromonas luteoviolacea]|uniref:MerR family transcriptional regulator n=1 Tax=Pseudoalteromonas luteoviolacea TaxID=43657 RepID=UPI001B38D25B|nr:MerR family transcriptional regulator [Pseudoalteromonas luteoviolacea]MBQ4810332.1 MerR family transcriptional regulator [Pseudoalteromonas luteoviolacea]
MLTVTELARKCEISRTAVLYYERVGLLTPNCRSENGYRWYSEREVKKLKSILAYRSFGMSVADIATLVSSESDQEQAALLKSQFHTLAREIQTLKRQQQAIVVMLQEPSLLEEKVVTKSRWVEIMISLGFSDKDMIEWHRNFERMKPEQHQAFLESLGIPPHEIKKIRSF